MKESTAQQIANEICKKCKYVFPVSPGLAIICMRFNKPCPYELERLMLKEIE